MKATTGYLRSGKHYKLKIRPELDLNKNKMLVHLQTKRPNMYLIKR